MTAIWHIYALIRRDTNKVFYIGCSKNPRQRLDAHYSERGGAKYPYMKKLEKAGIKVSYRTIKKSLDQTEAYKIEAREIDRRPDLINRTGVHAPKEKLKRRQQKRTITIQMRVTEQEMSAFDAAAAAAYMERPTWIRYTLHTAAQPQIAALSRTARKTRSYARQP